MGSSGGERGYLEGMLWNVMPMGIQSMLFPLIKILARFIRPSVPATRKHQE